MHLFELTRRLMEIESITENEREVGIFLEGYLQSLGYSVSLQEAAPDRFNVYASVTGSPVLVFSTHIDTVPPFLECREDDANLYGRGACDAKGIVAAQIHAAEVLRARGEKRVGLLFVVGEERNSAGALAANGCSPGSKFLINGEPTENRLAVGSKGSLRAEIVTTGRAAHSAYPERGDSAVLKLLDLLQDVRSLPPTQHPILGQTTCNIGILEGGTKANIIPARARAEIMFRSVEPLEDLKRRLEAAADGRAEIRYPFEVPPMLLHPAEGFPTTVVSFTSDVPFLSNWGKPYLMGPGSILDAHGPDEKISKQQLVEGVEQYVRLADVLMSTE